LPPESRPMQWRRRPPPPQMPRPRPRLPPARYLGTDTAPASDEPPQIPQPPSSDVSFLKVRRRRELTGLQQQPVGSWGHRRAPGPSPACVSGPRAAAARVQELRIRDFALVEDQTLHLDPGLVAVTGQSGTGKSVLVMAPPAFTAPPPPSPLPPPRPAHQHVDFQRRARAPAPSRPAGLQPSLAVCGWRAARGGAHPVPVRRWLPPPQVEALALLLGSAAPGDCIRPPATAAQVDGAFVLSDELAAAVDDKLRALGLPAKALASVNAQRLVLRREVRGAVPGGGHRCGGGGGGLAGKPE
jgi:hypothetical protein